MPRRHNTINIRNLSVKCGRCGQYQVLSTFKRLDEEWNVYVYECDWPPCDHDREGSQTLIEVPVDLDEFANRDPKWGGGKKHAGADGAPPADPESTPEAPEEELETRQAEGLVTLGR